VKKITEQERDEQDKRLKEKLTHIKNKMIVMSGKGGVGKTTVAVNLAYGLALREYKVGILDVDIHGPNIAKMLGAEDKRLESSPKGIHPVEILPNLKAISISFLLENRDQAVIWRGPLKMATIKQFIADIEWGELDFLVVDSPPGTGDEPLSVCQLITDINGSIIVTTPQDVAILDSRKSISFSKQLKVPVLGVVENMSGFVCPHCQHEIDLFGKGGGEKAALEFNVPFLGRIPVDPDTVKSGDSGKPFVRYTKDTESAKAMESIIDKIANVCR